MTDLNDLYKTRIKDLESQVFERGQIIGKLHDEVVAEGLSRGNKFLPLKEEEA